MPSTAAALLAEAPPSGPERSVGGVVANVINYNTALHTLRCVDSLLACAPRPDRIVVLDNASAPEDRECLRAGCAARAQHGVTLLAAADNLGFAAGSNLLIEHTLADPACRAVLLLNSDAVAAPDLVGSLLAALGPDAGRTGLAGGRMHRYGQPDEADTLGIALYASLMPADRKTLEDPYVGPTGGCMLLGRAAIEALREAAGYVFDPRYFCYCEDTDLVLRARLLGFAPAYVDAVLAWHEGQASSAQAPAHFIAYHGIRNAIWMHVKLMPARLLWVYGPLLLAAHLLSIGRHLLAGRFGLLARTYGDAWRRWGEMRAERARLLPADAAARLAPVIAPRFYRRGYLRAVWRGR